MSDETDLSRLCMSCNVGPRNFFVGKWSEQVWVCARCLGEHGAPYLRLLLCPSATPPADGKEPGNVSALTDAYDDAKREQLKRRLRAKYSLGAKLLPLEQRIVFGLREKLVRNTSGLSREQLEQVFMARRYRKGPR